MTQNKPAQQLSPSRRLGYGVGMSGLWVVFMPVGLYAFYFYTDVLGLSPTEAGLVFAIAVYWDAVTDVMMGWVASRTRTSIGQYRPYILIGAVPLAFCSVILFITPDLNAGALFIYALVAQLLFRTAFTIVYIPYTALIARLSTDANERASIAGIKNIFQSIGSLAVAFYGLKLVDVFGQGDDRQGFMWMAMFFAAISVICLLLSGSVIRERSIGTGAHALQDESHPVQALKLLFRNTPFLLIFFGVLAFTGCYSTLGKATVYYFQYDLGNRTDARYALAAISAAGVVSPFFWTWVTHATSKRFVWIAGCVLAAASIAVFYFGNFRDLTSITAAYFFAGCGIQAFLMTFYAITADAVDYGHWKNGQRTEAVSFALIAFANKTSMAIGGGLLGVGLSWVGYVAGQDQSPETLAGIRAILALVPITGFLASAAIIAFFPVSTAAHGEIERALAGHGDTAG